MTIYISDLQAASWMCFYCYILLMTSLFGSPTRSCVYFCHYFCRLPPIFPRDELFEWPINSHVFSNTKEPKSFKSYELVRKLKKDQL